MSGGSGIPKISAAWKEQHWRAPSIEDVQAPPEQTVCQLRMVSLLRAETVAELERRFDTKFQQVSEVQRLALATVVEEGRVTHARLREMTLAHPRDVTLGLGNLVQRGVLDSTGSHKATAYHFPGEAVAPVDPGLVFSGPNATGDSTPGSEHNSPDSEHKTARSEHRPPQDSEHKDDAALEAIAASIRSRRRAAPTDIEAVVVALCQGRFLTLPALARLTNRSASTLRTHYLSRMIEAGTIRLLHPDKPNHPDQAYTSTAP